MTSMEFGRLFRELTGNAPFPWQQSLYARFVGTEPGGIPASCSLPTGLGKTSVVAVWLIALATHPDRMPRRLAYVVNRRTVVDQTTAEAERYRRALTSDSLQDLAAALRRLYRTSSRHVSSDSPLAISTLRGEFADNGEWCEDPARPAIICGTVDMIGSRLLFSGYGIGRATRPMHAGFLGHDTLLVHDEAHLEPAFQQLVERIQTEQAADASDTPRPRLRVMELTATSRSQTPFSLTDDDLTHPAVQQRFHATKALFIHDLVDPKKTEHALLQQALLFRNSGQNILVFAQGVDTVQSVSRQLAKEGITVRTLTGTMRGWERDRLVKDTAFARFLGQSPETSAPETAYLVCTSAGEVGVNMSADHLICDLTPFDSMAQRLGRVNRFGWSAATQVHVFAPTQWDDKHPLTEPRKRTLALLRALKGEASPQALAAIPAGLRAEAFTPSPSIPPTSGALFDAWALTTIPGQLPGRPPVDPFLHGMPEDWEPPTTQVAWRTEVERLQRPDDAAPSDRDQLPDDAVQLGRFAAELLDDYALKPAELLSDRTTRVRAEITTLASAHPNAVVWIVQPDGQVAIHRLSALSLTEKRNGRNTYRVDSDQCTIVLPPFVGGLNSQGMLDGTAAATTTAPLDVADLIPDADTGQTARYRTFDSADPKARGMHLIRCVTLGSGDDDEDGSVQWYWFTRRNSGKARARKPVLLDVHVADVEQRMSEILSGLSIETSIAECLLIAARFHDAGKRRELFQAILGNRRAPDVFLAKSGPRSPMTVAEKYRHEFGSLHDLPTAAMLGITEAGRDVVLHLIAAHHGRARPHFPADEVFDPQATQALDEALARGVTQRFGRLQQRFGRWGLAYLESLLRAADWSASANPSSEVDELS